MLGLFICLVVIVLFMSPLVFLTLPWEDRMDCNYLSFDDEWSDEGQ